MASAAGRGDGDMCAAAVAGWAAALGHLSGGELGPAREAVSRATKAVSALAAGPPLQPAARDALVDLVVEMRGLDPAGPAALAGSGSTAAREALARDVGVWCLWIMRLLLGQTAAGASAAAGAAVAVVAPTVDAGQALDTAVHASTRCSCSTAGLCSLLRHLGADATPLAGAGAHRGGPRPAGADPAMVSRSNPPRRVCRRGACLARSGWRRRRGRAPSSAGLRPGHRCAPTGPLQPIRKRKHTPRWPFASFD
eukprot:SAG22_NODE_3367_length_1755_cov_42.324164_2_plen_253_part_00